MTSPHLLRNLVLGITIHHTWLVHRPLPIPSPFRSHTEASSGLFCLKINIHKQNQIPPTTHMSFEALYFSLLCSKTSLPAWLLHSMQLRWCSSTLLNLGLGNPDSSSPFMADSAFSLPAQRLAFSRLCLRSASYPTPFLDALIWSQVPAAIFTSIMFSFSPVYISTWMSHRHTKLKGSPVEFLLPYLPLPPTPPKMNLLPQSLVRTSTPPGSQLFKPEVW